MNLTKSDCFAKLNISFIIPVAFITISVGNCRSILVNVLTHILTLAGTLCDVDYDGCVDNPCVIGGCIDVPAAEYDPLLGITYSCNVTNCTTGYERLEINGVPEAECTGWFTAQCSMRCQVTHLLSISHQ